MKDVGVGFQPTFEEVSVDPTFETPEITGGGLSMKGDVTTALDKLDLI